MNYGYEVYLSQVVSSEKGILSKLDVDHLDKTQQVSNRY